MKIIGIIPSRYASTRFPGKGLADICGRPMIWWVYQQVKKVKELSKVYVATDDERILAAAQKNGGEAMMTRKDHATGTDRLAEVAASFPDVDLIVNVQGDEPLIEPSLIDALIAAFADDSELNMATVKTQITDEAEANNPNNVKVVTDKNGYALYFSRSLMPYPRHTGCPVYKHIGIYAYKRDFLLKYAKMEPTPLETAESLEQLRALENGYRIKVVETKAKFVGVDTLDDLVKVNEIYAQMQ